MTVVTDTHGSMLIDCEHSFENDHYEMADGSTEVLKGGGGNQIGTICVWLITNESAGNVARRLGAHFGFRRQNHAHNQAEQTDGGREDFHNQNLDEERRICGVRERRSGADHADRDAAKQIGHADRQAGAEDHVAGEPVARLVVQLGQFLFLILFDGAEQNDRHDDAVDCDRLAEDDRHQIFGLDSGRLHTATDDRNAGGEDTECGADHA